MPPSITGNSLGWLDYLVIALYLGVNVGIGWWVQRQKRTTNADYFLGGGRVPPWASAISWYGTAVSSVSFMALPAYAYSKDWLPMIVGPAGSGVGIIVAYCFLGIIRRLKAPTIFAYLEARFDRNVRLIVAGLSMVLKVFGRASVIMVLPALALASATGMNVYLSIVMMGIVTTAYSMEGGFEAVVWTDVMQVLVMFAGVFFMVWYAAAGVDGGLAGIIREGSAANKFQFISWEHNLTDVTAWVITGFFIGSVFTMISDQALMQRALAAKSDRDARRTVIMGSLLGFPSNAVFFFVGTALFAFYHLNPARMVPGLPNDAIVGYFIANELPPGVVGVIVAGLFAAAMGALSSILNSTAAVVVSDFQGTFQPHATESQRLRLAKLSTLICGALGIAMASWLAAQNAASLWDEFMKLIALLGGGFAGVFALGLLTRRAHSVGVMIGALASIPVTWSVQKFTTTSPFAHGFVAVASCMVIGYLASLLLPAPAKKSLLGLTLWDPAVPK